MLRRIAFLRIAPVCALFLCIDLILSSTVMTTFASSVASSHVWAHVVTEGFPDTIEAEFESASESYWIRINIPAFTLTLFLGETPIRTYPIAVGKPASPSRIGTCEIVEKAKYPTWYPPDGGPPVPPGPDNPISSRWLGLSWPGYGIHGTNNPSSIGKAVTLGCIRMYDEDVMELFDIVPVGTKVELVYETLEVSSNGSDFASLRLTVHRDLYGMGTNAVERALEVLERQLSEDLAEEALSERFDVECSASELLPKMPDIDTYALAALLSSARGVPEPIPWQVKVNLGVTDTIGVETGLVHIEGSDVYVAIRPVAEALGYRVSWDKEWQAALINQKVVTGVVREGTLYVTLDELTRLLDDVVVTWDPQTLTLTIRKM